MEPLDVLLQTAMSCLNVPGKWGGNHPLEGFDCSGFMGWVLRAAGEDPPGDQWCQAYYDYFIKHGSQSLAHPSLAGTIVFYSPTGSVADINHMAMMLSQWQIIEAGRVTPGIKTLDDARRVGAMVRVRHIRDRESQIVAKIRPVYSSIDLMF